MPASVLDTGDPPSPKQLQTYVDKQSDEIKTTGYVTTGLDVRARARCTSCPSTALHGPHARHARPHASGSCASTARRSGGTRRSTRFALPHRCSRSLIPSLGAILGLGMVAWGFFDRNGQGIHDKLAETLVVVDA